MHQTVPDKEMFRTAQFQTSPSSEIYQTAQELNKPVESSERAKSVKPEALPLVMSSYGLISTGDFKKALLVLEQALEIAPNDLRALLLKVQILLLLRKLRDADKTTSLIMELYPGDHHVYLAKAISTLFYTTNMAESLKYINKGLEIRSDCIELVLAKAQILYLMKDPTYNAWVLQASEIDASRTDTFLKKYWIEHFPEPPSHTGAEIHGLLQTLMFLASQQSFGGWK
ncbi:MAG: tetratricopeptide repeat protein [Nanoarchaeota archaeon]|nr:tetratricopeptide repeat protein [Nanoarchaeota archaeon]MCG2723223.1 tetratricopeptide repeat protein [archaeon]